MSAPAVTEETLVAPAPVCSPSRDALIKQGRLTDLAVRLLREERIAEDEFDLLRQAAEGIWDDAVHIAAPWEKRSSLCGNWGRNLVALDVERPDGMSGCWTCLMASEWIKNALDNGAEGPLALERTE